MIIARRFCKNVGAFVIKEQYAYDVIRTLLENGYVVCSYIRNDGDIGIVFYIDSEQTLMGFDNGIKYLGRAEINNKGIGWHGFVEILKENGYRVETDTYGFDVARNQYKKAEIGFYKPTENFSPYRELFEMCQIAGIKIS